MTDFTAMEQQLQKLLDTLKVNREKVPLETLKTYYQVPYEALKAEIGKAVRDFTIAVVGHHLLVNPYLPLEEQLATVRHTVSASRIPSEISKSITKDYDIATIYRLALALRKEVEDALWLYINRETCLVADLFHLEEPPVIYNTLTKHIYEDGQWQYAPMDLKGKLLIYQRETAARKTCGSPTEGEEKCQKN